MMGLFYTREQNPADAPGSRPRASYVAEAVLLLIATVCLGWYGYNWIASEVDQLWSNYSLDARLAGKHPSVSDFIRQIAQRSDTDQHETTSDKPSEANTDRAESATGESPDWPEETPVGEDIGRIEIPRLRISSIVRQGVDDHTLSRAVGHVPYTAMPGRLGNVGLAAHRDTYFRNLRGVKPGDVIRLITPKGTFEYSVESLKIVYPANVEVLDPTPNPSLTLVTCYPFNFVGHAPKRFIVRARQIQPALPAPRR